MAKMTTGFYALRFEILERDAFTCQYCGQSAPDVILSVDHKIPKAKGGSDFPENLLAACTACNIGKNTRLKVAPSEFMPALPPRIQRIETFLLESGPATGTAISRALQIKRSDVAKILSGSGWFQRVKKEGKNVYYFPSLLDPLDIKTMCAPPV